MQRRCFLLAVCLAPLLSPSVQATAPLTVIYIGGWDCLPCAAWKRQHKAEWLASPEFVRIKWIEIEAPHLTEAYDDAYWPPDLRQIRDQLPKKVGTPRFLIVRDGKVVSNHFGKWPNTLADLKRLLARQG